jgi:hypothetical protein
VETRRMTAIDIEGNIQIIPKTLTTPTKITNYKAKIASIIPNLGMRNGSCSSKRVSSKRDRDK